MKKVFIMLAAILIISSLILSACSEQTTTTAAPAQTTTTAAPAQTTTAAPAQTTTVKPIEIKCMTLTRDTPALDSFDTYKFILDKINAAANGQLIMVDAGGPDAIPAGSQPQAVQSGVIDFVHSGTGFFAGIVKEIQLLEISPLSTKDEMDRGFVTFLNQFCTEQGVFLLGRNPNDMNNEVIVLRNHLSVHPSDLKGLRCAGLNIGDKTAAQALGMDYINIDRADRYTSLEKGLVDGLMISPGAAGYLKLHEIAKYYINHPFYRKDSLWMFNNEKFSGLPAHLQKLIVDTYYSTMAEAAQLYMDADEVNEKVLIAGGCTPLVYSESDAKLYNDAIFNENADRVLSTFSSIAPKVHEIWGK